MQYFHDTEQPTLVCEQCRPEEEEEQAAYEALANVRLTDKDRETVARLVTLAADPGAMHGESAEAARAACKILAAKGGLDLIRHKPPKPAVRRPVRRGGRTTW